MTFKFWNLISGTFVILGQHNKISRSTNLTERDRDSWSKIPEWDTMWPLRILVRTSKDYQMCLHISNRYPNEFYEDNNNVLLCWDQQQSIIEFGATHLERANCPLLAYFIVEMIPGRSGDQNVFKDHGSESKYVDKIFANDLIIHTYLYFKKPIASQQLTFIMKIFHNI